MKLSYDRTRLRRITAATEFGKVAVLYGGASTEREISLVSGKAVLAALQRRGIDATGVDPRDESLFDLGKRGFVRAFIALHGPGGEDGSVQGALEVLGLPYTGSGVQGSALGMDKLRTKRLAAALGVMTADSVVLRTVGDCALAVERLGLPLIVKPATQGSSVGMSKVTTAAEMEPAYRVAAAVDDVVFAEKWITGSEYTVAVLHRRVLPAIRIEAANAFYDYEAKYKRNDTKYHCPAGLSAQAESHMASLALAAFDAIGAEGWGRVDFMADHTGRPLLLEINTVPGMTDHSLVPMAARAAGIDFDELCWQVLETSFVRQPLGGQCPMMFWRRKSQARNRRKEQDGWSLRLPAINWGRLLPTGLTLLALVAAVFSVRLALDRPVEHVEVSGRWQRVQALDVQKVVRTAVGHQGMVSVDLQAVSRAVRRNPWVDRASVARSWPRALSVQVVEQVPVARWGASGLLNARGEVFVRDEGHLPAELPELAGPAGSEAEMTRRLLAAQPRLVEAGLRLSRLRLDERGAWEIELDNGVQLRLGRALVDDVLVDERFDRFIVAASRLVATRATEIRYVDMRYANGFAIGWRKAAGEVERG